VWNQSVYLFTRGGLPVSSSDICRPETARLVKNTKCDLVWKEAIISLLQVLYDIFLAVLRKISVKLLHLMEVNSYPT
jgi:hypothetical protein